MAKDTNYEQFKGQGMKYAPKAPKPAPKPAEAAPAPAATGPSEEDKIRNAVRTTRAAAPDSWWQSTDGHQ